MSDANLASTEYIASKAGLTGDTAAEAVPDAAAAALAAEADQNIVVRTLPESSYATRISFSTLYHNQQLQKKVALRTHNYRKIISSVRHFLSVTALRLISSNGNSVGK